MSRQKNNNDGLTINSDCACIHGKVYLGLQGHTNVLDIYNMK